MGPVDGTSQCVGSGANRSGSSERSNRLEVDERLADRFRNYSFLAGSVVY